MEKLSRSKRAAVLSCLIEGNSILSTVRITGVAKTTILRFLAEAGEACTTYHDRVMVNLPCRTIQLDEVWSFVGCKEKTKPIAKGEHPGDVWTWTAICADTKLIPCWRVGDRGNRTAYAFCDDLSGRFAHKLQITSDGHPAYQWAVGSIFQDADFAMLCKIYRLDDKGQDVCIGAKKTVMRGNPNLALISTSYVERANLTIRMTNRRFTRKTNGYSKKLDNHAHNLALCLMAYNFCKKHSTLKTTPAVAAGLTDHQWSLDEVADMIEAYAKEREDAAFEAAFEAKVTQPRQRPKTYEPTPKHLIPLAWYLLPTEPETPPSKAGEDGSLDLS